MNRFISRKIGESINEITGAVSYTCSLSWQKKRRGQKLLQTKKY